MPPKVTLADVGAEAGVSTSTVSLVLNDSPRIPEATKAHVRSVAERMGYVYNRQAAALRSGTTNTIGLIVTEVTNPYFADIAMTFEQELAAAGYSLLVGYSRDEHAVQERLVSTFLGHHVSGLVLLPAAGPSELQTYEAIKRSGVPTLMIARDEESDFDYVGPDNFSAGRLLGEHLARLGVTSISYVGGNEGNASTRDRFDGVRTTAGVADERIEAVAAPVTMEGGYRATKSILERDGSLPDVFIANSDITAIGIYAALTESGVRVGTDVAVAGFDDVAFSQWQNPPLTTVATHPQRIGRHCAEVLIGRLKSQRGDGRGSEKIKILIQPELRERESTLRWRGSEKSDG